MNSKVFVTGLLVSLVGVFALTGCETFMTREDIKRQEEDRQIRETVTTMQKSKADRDNRLSDMEGDLRSMNGRIEALEHNQQGSSKSQESEIQALKKMVEAQNEKLKLIENHMDATEQRLTAAIQAMAEKPSAASAPEPAVKGGKKAAASEAAFEDAENAFTSKDYKKAIVKFQNYRDKYPKGPKQAEAAYKIWVCFAELGMKKDAKEFWQEVLEKYPSSPIAKKAKSRLGQK